MRSKLRAVPNPSTDNLQIKTLRTEFPKMMLRFNEIRKEMFSRDNKSFLPSFLFLFFFLRKKLDGQLHLSNSNRKLFL